jgi:hypothetical protein
LRLESRKNGVRKYPFSLFRISEPDHFLPVQIRVFGTVCVAANVA